MGDYAAGGSQRWLQIAVEQHPDVLLRAWRDPLELGSCDTIEWRSPLRSDRFTEDRDGEALCKLGVDKRPVSALNEFWPARGVVWDAVGTVSNGEPIFVEAKAHIAEAASPATQASPESPKLITKSLEEARKYYAPEARLTAREKRLVVATITDESLCVDTAPLPAPGPLSVTRS